MKLCDLKFTQLQLNSAKLCKIPVKHSSSQISAVNAVDTLTRGMTLTHSYSSSCISEAFFDAREYASAGQSASSDDSASGSDDDDLTSDDETVSGLRSLYLIHRYRVFHVH